jgi:hypothetical protein
MLESGQELSARFVLVRRLGAGGSGSVWLAQDRERGCHVAVKLLDAALPAAVAMLRKECERVAALAHPNILRVDGFHQSGGLAWIAMEYASGGDLSQLRGHSCIEVLRATVPVAAALACAHDAGLVHRDVKPANVLLSADGTPRLTDFGMALAVGAAPAANAGRGSVFSASPQQLAGEPAAVSDDIYGFGALLYELLSDYPPHYPDAAAARTAKEVAPLPASVPSGLAGLVMRMLARSPADRPADLRTIERELRALLASLPAIMSTMSDNDFSNPVRIEPPSLRAPPGQGEVLRGEWRRAGANTTSEADLRRQGFRRGFGAAAIAVGIVGIGIVFFALPKWVAHEQPARYAQASSPIKPEQPAAAPEKKEVDFAELARLKQQAEDQRAAINERLEKLSARAAAQWGGEEFQRATDELAAGDKEFEAREFEAAAKRFAAMEPLIDAVEKRAPAVLAEQLKAGAAALRDGRSEDARNAFELAAKIEPANQVAAKGLKRAATLDEVLNLVATAERLEKEGNAVAAAENFRKALALDAEAPRATEALARIASRQASDAFAAAMAKGYSALAAADYGQARNSFEAARRIRPDAPQIGQALRQIEQEQRTGAISVKLKDAQQLEAQEKWADALKEYRAVLQLDSTIAAANEGVQRVEPRSVLNEQLELYLTQPERLFSQPVRAAARDTLARAKAISAPGPLLTQQTQKLSDWLARADVPVAVALRSDNFTQVTIYRVGALGTFEQRSLQLAPGSYTVVGTRPGYRDVRREINVAPGSTLEPVVIRCEDRI